MKWNVIPKAMNPEAPDLRALAAKIAETEEKLQKLEAEIDEIGQPAAYHVKHRLDALKTEEHALKRNLAELLEMDSPDEVRMDKVKALMGYIEREESSAEHEADFLQQAAPSSAELQTRASLYLMDLCMRGLRRIVGDHHPLGMSVFVNHSRQDLEEQYGLEREEPSERPAEGV